MEVIKSYSIYLNTREANIGDSNNCTFTFRTPLVLTNGNNRFRVSTPMIEIPYSFSQLNTNNYTLPFTYFSVLGSYSLSIQFPEGNFNINQLISTFISLMVSKINTSVPGSALTDANFAITYNSTTSTVTWQIIGVAYAIQLSLNFVVGFVIGTMFGYLPDTFVILTTTAPGTAPNKVMVNPITSIYIRSESLKFESNYEAVVRNIASVAGAGNFQNSDIVAKIPVTTLPNSIIYFRSDYRSIVTNKYISELNLYVSDNLSPSYTLDLQGLNYGIYVLFEEVEMPKTNAYKDILETSVAMPKSIIQERDLLLADLIKKKEELEKEIEQSKKNIDDNQKDVDERLAPV
jgi:hypothetical protein